MAKKTEGDSPRSRFDLRVDPSLTARIERQATRLGISSSAYIRMAITRQVERDEADAPAEKKRK